MTMDREKLDKAAKKCATEMWCGEPKGEYIVDLVDYDNIIDAFKQGAEWLQSQPIADRLTEIEREKVKNVYIDCMEIEDRYRYRANVSPFAVDKAIANRRLIELIFGKELFEK